MKKPKLPAKRATPHQVSLATAPSSDLRRVRGGATAIEYGVVIAVDPEPVA